MEKLVITNKVIENGYITKLNWVWVYSNETVNSYSINGIFTVIECGLALSQNISDEVLMTILENNLQIQNFRDICYADLGLKNI